MLTLLPSLGSPHLDPKGILTEKDMKKISVISALAILVIALIVPVASASTINFDGSHEFYITVMRLSDSTYLSPGSGNITTAFTDYAYYNPSEGTSGYVGPTNVTVGTPSSVSTSQAAGTWLIDRNTTTGYSGPLGSGKYGGSISRNFTALGPDPDLDVNGYVGQQNWRDATSPPTIPKKEQLLHVVYTVPTDATYRVFFSDTYNFTASVSQGTGSSFPVSYFDGYSLMGVKILAGLNYSDNAQLLYDKTYGATGSSSAIASFSDTVTGRTFTLGDFDYLMTAGQNLTLDVYLTANYNAETTMIPIPASVLLLGSGLVGLLALRGRHGFSKD